MCTPYEAHRSISKRRSQSSGCDGGPSLCEAHHCKTGLRISSELMGLQIGVLGGSQVASSALYLSQGIGGPGGGPWLEGGEFLSGRANLHFCLGPRSTQTQHLAAVNATNPVIRRD